MRLQGRTAIVTGAASGIGRTSAVLFATEGAFVGLVDRDHAGLRETLAAIEGLVELGMTPSQAIVSATKNGAIASQGLKEFGTLEVGKLADLLVLDADPLADIHNIHKLSLVMRDGRIIDREKLPEKPVWTKAKTKA